MWGSRPTADQLLDARVLAGWVPVPTDTRDGPVVMGHACKLPRPGA